MKKTAVTGLIIILMMTGSVAASDVGNGPEALKMTLSAKGSALGDALGADSSLDALFYNPAGIANIALFENKGLGFSYVSLSKQGFMQTGLCGFLDLKSVGVLGLSLFYNDNGSIPLFTLNPDNTVSDTGTSFTAMDLVGRLAFARSFLDNRLNAGLEVSVLNSKIENYSATGFGADAGIQYRNLIPNLTLGLSAKNIGTGIRFIEKETPYPLLLNLALKYIIIDAALVPDHFLAVYLDSSILMSDSSLCFGSGLEYGFMKMAYFRLGYRMEKENLYAFSAGLGLKYQFLTMKPELDVSFLPQQEFGNKLYITFLLNF